MLHIKVLGPLELRSQETPEEPAIEIGSPRHREVLAALVVDMGYVVSTDALFDRVWAGGRGATAANLHAIISRLRARLRTGAGESGLTIETIAPGYRLGGRRDAVDAVVFTDLMAASREAIAAADLLTARSHLAQALTLWRGPAYADIALPFAETESARLATQKLAAEELAAHVDLELGRHVELTESLPRLVREHPVHEALRGQLMLALYRSSRQVEALDVFEQGKAILLDELGLDPGPQLQHLHQQILQQSSELDWVDSEQGRATLVPAPPPKVRESVSIGGRTPQLIGRDREIAYVSSVAREPGLLTLTGVGGVGKTSLASAVTDQIASGFADGQIVVPLAVVGAPELVIPAIGAAVGLTSTEGLDPLGALIEHLRGLHVLVVLDNLEHLLDIAPELAAIVAACPRVTMLVTSRAPLRVRGESEYQVQPLLLPTEDETTVATIEESGAGALFLAHARRASPGFAVAPEVASTVATICHRLGGIPLALELAAAKLRVLGPTGLLERLDVLLDHGGARDLPKRQRTMRATIDWSYQLLDPDEQQVFRRISVFAGGFSVAAAEDVGGGRHVLEVLETLAEQSLLVTDRSHDAVRFRLLEPVRQYAASQLGDGPEAEETRDRHLQHYLALAEQMLPHYRGPGTMEALDTSQVEQGNVNVALDWAVKTDRVDEATRLIWAMWLFWWLRARLVQGMQSMAAVMSLKPTGADLVRCLAVRAAMEFAQGENHAAQRDWDDAAALAADLDFPEGLAVSVGGQGIAALAGGDFARAEDRFRACIQHAERAGEDGIWIWTLSHVWLGTIRLQSGSADEAAHLAQTALDAGRSRGDRLATYISLFTSVQVALARDDVERAWADVAEGIGLSLETGDASNLAYFLDALVVVEARRDADATRAATLTGAAAGLREGIGANVYAYYLPDVELQAAVVARARTVLGDEAYERAWQAGRHLDVTESAAFALNQELNAN